VPLQYGVQSYLYTDDLAGNRLSESLALNGGSPTVTSYSYNAANQITNSGFTYDANGNLLDDGLNTYTWDRANRLLSMGGASYAYDGAGNRISQTVSSIVTQYLLDLQPGLVTVLAATTSGNTDRYVHAPRGIHAQKDASGNWEWMVQDGLGSVQSIADNNLNILWTGSPEPYGVYFGESGTRQSPYLFTGEYTDPITGLVHLRARDYNPMLGVFTSLDPLETANRYGYVNGNPVNYGDPTGMVVCSYIPGGTEERRTCVRKYQELSRNYGITLTEDATLSATKDNWISARVNNVYLAVQAIAEKLEGGTFQAIGGTEMRLLPQSPGEEASRASTCNRISLFLSYKSGGTTYSNWVHTAPNIVHELGHIFTEFRNTAPQNAWREISRAKMGTEPPTTINDNQSGGILGSQGWSDFNLRENQGKNSNLVAEVVADMFMFWVLGYAFSSDEWGQLRQDYVNGGPIHNISSRPVDGDNPLIVSGMRQWAAEATPCSTEGGNIISDVELVDYLNNGACDSVDTILALI
jgi:RHS repeat-associated protein